jgi:uncharacterized protein YehS (DUF1456 family)
VVIVIQAKVAPTTTMIVVDVIVLVKVIVVVEMEKMEVEEMMEQVEVEVEIEEITAPLNSFTDGLIPSVTGMHSVGKIITDDFTDRTRPSV